MEQIKVGDRVKLVISDGSSYSKVGSLGTVVHINGTSGQDTIGVEFDVKHGGHTCNGRGKSGHCRYYKRSGCHLEIIYDINNTVKISYESTDGTTKSVSIEASSIQSALSTLKDVKSVNYYTIG